ncbi:TetR/AcrR family transcriptional regulator [Streptomyces sp. NPDC002088]|uniref:TetR/AcrR family transcriptional regulator n=1 Tax=Streptomyces sp. NPDC002088 TaxID=3154665 RepID=UPI00331FCCEE
MGVRNSESSPAGESLREAQKRLTRERLIEAAFTAFRERGYATATAAHIAAEAGASRATFYLYFPSKAEVVIELLERIEPAVLEAYQRLDSLPDPSLDAVSGWVEDVVAWWERDRLRFEAMEQALAVEPKVSERWYESLRRAADAMPHHLETFLEGEERDKERLRLVTLMAQLDRTMYFTVVRGVLHDREQLVRVLAEQWWAVLGHKHP